MPRVVKFTSARGDQVEPSNPQFVVQLGVDQVNLAEVRLVGVPLHREAVPVRVKPRMVTPAPGSSAQVSVRGHQNPFCAPITDMDTSTPLGRAFADQSSGLADRRPCARL
jgi:hypothetical protein